METPDATLFAAPTIPSTLFTVAALDEPSGAGDNESTKKGKRMNYQNWEIAAIIYGCHAAYVTKPKSTM